MSSHTGKKKGKTARNYLILEGRKLAVSWWGLAWNQNLESYSDFSNRLPRARTYLRAGRVFNLTIEKGNVTARVDGSRRTPYRVDIRIDPLSEERIASLQAKVNRQIENIEALLKGEFPESLAELFSDRKNGLFPSPKEIHLSCSCPDWAYLCKHVGAVLYGIGAAFDKDPLLFFTLRGIDMSGFIRQSLEDKLNRLLGKPLQPSRPILDDASMNELFGL